MKKLVSFGDSFTYGSELSDYDALVPSRLVWPSLLAKEYNLEYKTYAIEGCSNHTILRKLLENTKELKDSFVIINWTWTNRWEFYSLEDEKWSTLRPSGTEDSKFYKFYYKNIQSELWDKYETLKNIYLAKNILIENNVDFVFTSIDKVTLDKTFHCPPYIKKLINNVEEHFIWFDDMSFLDWSKHNNFKISEKFHPLDDAHIAAFNYMCKKLTIKV